MVRDVYLYIHTNTHTFIYTYNNYISLKDKRKATLLVPD